MQSPLHSNSKHLKVNQYVFKEILEATPEQLTLKVYDFAILNCNRKNMIKANEAIQELIDSLNFDGEAREISTGLFRLYRYCQDQNRKANFEISTKILTELRDTWIDIFNKNKMKNVY